ncbi:MAG: glycosyltransferase [Porticoccaceae bacterium]|nr:glycosyltransferase [Porticoccaceae bacterium]
MKRNKVLFVCPKYDESRISGTSVRPIQMLQALKDVYGPENVVEAVGESSDRRKVYKNLDIDELHLVYMENSTMPLALTDDDHIPRNIFLEYTLFQKCKNKNISVFVFYRDVRWRFNFYKRKHKFLKRMFAYTFYFIELALYKLSNVKLCMPSCHMADYVPLYSRDTVIKLPPGSSCGIAYNHSYNYGEKFRLLYTGGILPPVYDLTEMFSVLENIENIELVLVCRAVEWKLAIEANMYKPGANVKIVHESGAALESLFRHAHAFLDFREGTEYLNFSMPIKIFESIGAGLPVICKANTAYGNYVKHNHAGWVFEDSVGLISGLKEIVDSPEEYIEIAKKTNLHSKDVTWISRIEKLRALVQ